MLENVCLACLSHESSFRKIGCKFMMHLYLIRIEDCTKKTKLQKGKRNFNFLLTPNKIFIHQLLYKAGFKLKVNCYFLNRRRVCLK